MKHLVIVESPSKSKTIMKYLGEDYEVVSSKGHIRDLATSGKGGLGVDIENDFKPNYVVDKEKKALVKDLKTRAKAAQDVYLATDPDREGEAISWHLADELGLDISSTKRVVFNEITKQAILEAFNQPRNIDMNLVKSQETRRILDRIIGFKLSSLLYKKIRSKSAGRVQSVALKLVVERENEIKAFIPEEVWKISANFEKKNKNFEAELDKYLKKKFKVTNQIEADKVLGALDEDFTITNIEETDGKPGKKYPYITSTLQQDASSKLFYASKRTMMIAQKLYEGISIKGSLEGLITYMRTDSTRLSDQFIMSTKDFIEHEYGKQYVGSYTSKKIDNAQDAHEAIRPTHIEYTPESIKDYLNADELKIYSLIYNRALASIMSLPKTKITTVTLSNHDYDFVAKGTTVIFDGYNKILAQYDNEKEKQLPPLSINEVLKSLKTEAKQSFTNPPARYTEATLIKAMEEKGIGRPSTYSSIIETIVFRKYVNLEKNEKSRTKYFTPTDQGFLTDTKLQEHFSSIINTDYTAHMETELDEIAEGKLNHIDALNRFYDTFNPLMTKANDEMEKIQPVLTGDACPQCGKPLVKKIGKYGPFVACSDYPTCKYIEKKESTQTEAEPTGEACPQCGKPLIKKTGRFGPFVACSDYPTCKYIKNDRVKTKAIEEPTGEMCPRCGKPLVKKTGRFGPFIGCGDYPKCKYIQPKAKKNEE